MTLPIIWNKNNILIGNKTHIDIISDYKIDLEKENYNLGRCTEDFNTLYYYSFSELNNPNLNKIFKNFIQQDL